MLTIIKLDTERSQTHAQRVFDELVADKLESSSLTYGEALDEVSKELTFRKIEHQAEYDDYSRRLAN